MIRISTLIRSVKKHWSHYNDLIPIETASRRTSFGCKVGVNPLIPSIPVLAMNLDHSTFDFGWVILGIDIVNESGGTFAYDEGRIVYTGAIDGWEGGPTVGWVLLAARVDTGVGCGGEGGYC